MSTRQHSAERSRNPTKKKHERMKRDQQNVKRKREKWKERVPITFMRSLTYEREQKNVRMAAARKHIFMSYVCARANALFCGQKSAQKSKCF